MSGRKGTTWENREVETFLCLFGEEEVQRELAGSVRNERIFQLVSQRMAAAGYLKSTEQCRLKSKKLRSEYRKIKAHDNSEDGYRKAWKWFDMMDAIYGHRPPIKGIPEDRETSTATSSLQEAVDTIEKPKTTESSVPSPIRRVAQHPVFRSRIRPESLKRRPDNDTTKEFLSAMSECHMQWLEKETEQRRGEWEREAELRREEMKQEMTLRREEAEREEKLRREEMEARSKDTAQLTSCLMQIAKIIAKDPAIS